MEIPIHEKDEVIEIELEKLPAAAEALEILKDVKARLHVWHTLAVSPLSSLSCRMPDRYARPQLAYYEMRKEAKNEEEGRQKESEFVEILEAAVEKIMLHMEQGLKDVCLQYPEFEKDEMRTLDTLAAFYVRQARMERNIDKKRELFQKATKLYTTADKISMDDQNLYATHLLGRAYFCLLSGEAGKIDQATAQFNIVLQHDPHNVPATLGQACIAFNNKLYTKAFALYKKALQTERAWCPADVRLGLGHCYYKLGKVEKAKMAFERALQLDNKCVGALVGLAVIELNKKTPENIRRGVQMLSRAYQCDQTDPMALNHLANHFFFKKDYNKVQHLALHAFHNTENEAMRAESCYQLARSYHVQEDYDQAFQYYYQSTQFAPSNFVLPQYGLGQLYILRGDTENASACFEKVLKIHPGNYETMKILGSLYAGSAVQAKRDLAKTYLKKVTEQIPDDVEAWIELAQILEQNDMAGALAAYGTAIKILQEKVQVEIPPEILNNVAALHFRLNNLPEAAKNYELSLERCRTEFQNREESYYESIATTIHYNTARLYEAQNESEKAVKEYKDILREHPNYIDCYLRLGCIARDRGQINDASYWFKEVFRISQNHADGWSLIGNMHMAKQEWGPAQKKFERIISQAETKEDTYSHVALGNIWLQTLHQPTRDREKEKRHQDRALQLYKQVLRLDNRNIYATNGIGCVLAYKGHIPEARDVFAQVREATADFPDVWLNIAHIYVEQKQYTAAIQMYENCLKKFFKHHNTEILMYIARAHYKCASTVPNSTAKLRECKKIILKARRVAPYDPVILYNLALVLEKLAMKVMQDEKSVLSTVLSAVHELGLAKKYFSSINELGDRQRFDLDLVRQEEKRCQDLLHQATFHVARAKNQDEQERKVKQQQEAERNALRAKFEEEQQKVLEEKQKKAQEMIEKRTVFKEQTKDKLLFSQLPEEKPQRKKQRRQDADDFVTDGSGSENEDGTKKRKRRHSGGEGDRENRDVDRKRKRHKKRRGDDDRASGDEEAAGPSDRKEDRKRRRDGRKDTSRGKGKDRGHSGRDDHRSSSSKNSRFRSKEFIDSSSDSDDENKSKLVIADEKTSDPSSASDSDHGSEKRKRSPSKSPSDSDSDIEIKKKSKKKFAVQKFAIGSDEEREHEQGAVSSQKNSSDDEAEDDEEDVVVKKQRLRVNDNSDSEVERSPVASPAPKADHEDSDNENDNASDGRRNSQDSDQDGNMDNENASPAGGNGSNAGSGDEESGNFLPSAAETRSDNSDAGSPAPQTANHDSDDDSD